MCSKEDYLRWKNGELIRSYSGKFEPAPQTPDEDGEGTYKEYNKSINEYFEGFYEEHITPSGDVVVAFGYSGTDN